MARAKGTAIVQAVKGLRAAPDVARKLLAPHLHHYLTERILVSSWYPEEEYLALITALSRMFPAGGKDVWEIFGPLAAQHDLTTVYRGMVRSGTLLSTLRAFKELFRVYHDTGRLEISGTEEHAILDIFDYASVSAGHCRFLTSYMREHLRMAVGREFRCSETRCRAHGQPHCRREFEP